MKKLFLIVLVAVIASCSDDSGTTPIAKNGKWVEIETKSDTLSFGTLDDLEIMTLDRGNELQNGILKPKYRSGPYEYGLSEDKISLRWVLSSNSNFEEYSFRIENERLYIGNFYGSASGEILTFEKLE